MNRAIVRIVLIITVILLSLTGCWSGKEIQNLGYAKALGIDYIDNEFIVYAQMLDFTSIAKMEGGGSSGPNAPVWVGKGRGKSFNMAVTDLYKTSQLRINWGHLTAIVLTERALKAKVEFLSDMIVRYPEIRYNAWLYGTRSSLEELLSATPMFKKSPIASILHSPEDNFSQISLFPPVYFFKYLSKYNEKAGSAYLPSLSLNEAQWKENKKKHGLLMIDGGFFESNRKIRGYLSRQKMLGYHWLQANTHRAPINIERDGILYGEIIVDVNKIKIKPVIQGSEVHFHILAKLTGSNYEYVVPISREEMNQIGANIIKSQIMNTYIEGLKIGVDIYGLEVTLFRKHPKLWKKLTNNGDHLLIDKQSIEKLDIRLNIPYNGRNKRIVDNEDL
ncbi:MAG: Ger(x)C family spore germination protein [Candidatus Pristimantibacillus sp.]